MKALLYIKYELSVKPGNNKTVPLALRVNVLVTKIAALYKKACIPTVSKRRIFVLITKHHTKYGKLMKSYRQRSSTEKFKNNVQAMVKDSKKLFDIAACKCTGRNQCQCKPESVVSSTVFPFLLDQRRQRKMYIANSSIEFDQEPQV